MTPHTPPVPTSIQGAGARLPASQRVAPLAGHESAWLASLALERGEASAAWRCSRA